MPYIPPPGAPPARDPNAIPSVTPKAQGPGSAFTQLPYDPQFNDVKDMYGFQIDPLYFQQKLDASGLPTEIPYSQFYQQNAQKMANATPRANPYSPQLQAMADQARPGLQGVYGQMMQQANGPSIASMQAQGAQGSNLQAALGARGNNAGVAMQAGQGGAGIANGAATLGAQQQAQQFAGAGALAGGMRGRDINQAQNVTEAALQQRQIDNAQRQFYAQQGSNLANSSDQAALEAYKFKQRLIQQKQQQIAQGVKSATGLIANAVSGSS